MADPGTGALRVLRGLVLLSTVTGLVLGAHVLGGGAVSAVPAVALAVLLWPACLGLTRRRVRLPALLSGLAVGQVVGHAVLSFFGSPGTRLGSLAAACLEHSGRSGHSGHSGHSAVVACAAHGGASLPDHGLAMATTPSTGMVASHAVATLVTALVLAHGEAVLWRVLDLALRPVPRLVQLQAVASSLGGVLRPLVARPATPLPLGRAPPVAA